MTYMLHCDNNMPDPKKRNQELCECEIQNHEANVMQQWNRDVILEFSIAREAMHDGVCVRTLPGSMIRIVWFASVMDIN